MKKKIATFVLLMFSALCVLTGCNLFNKDNSMSLNSIVASNGKYTVTREELINAYNNGGYYYAYSYGYSQEEALQKTIDELLDQKYLIDYLDSQPEYALTSDDYSEVVANTWEYLDSGLKSYLNVVKQELDIEVVEESEEEKSEDPEYAVKAGYVSKFTTLDGKIVYKETDAEKEKRFNRTFTGEDDAKAFALTYIDEYEKHIDTTNKDLKTRTWKRFISALKSAQKSYKYSDMSDSAVITRQIEKIFLSNLDSQKITKFQERVKDHNGLKYDATLGKYVPLDTTLTKIAEKYAKKYDENVSLYNSFKDKNNYYKALSTTSYRDNFVYYGNQSEETMITCTHILIKLSDTQTANISALKNKYSGEKLEIAKALEESADNTPAFERSLETGEVVDNEGISVTKLYENIQESLKNVTDLEERVSIFNDYLYKYNVDKGIINAKYDYVVGTKNSQMVETFTNLVRDLYNDGKGTVGSIGMVYESNDNYSGYHIVMYTGTLNNLYNNSKEVESLSLYNVYDVLSKVKTSLSYNENLFDYFYDAVVTDNYNTIKANLIDSQKNGQATTYNKGNYSDLY